MKQPILTPLRRHILQLLSESPRPLLPLGQLGKCGFAMRQLSLIGWIKWQHAGEPARCNNWKRPERREAGYVITAAGRRVLAEAARRDLRRFAAAEIAAPEEAS